MSKPNLIIRPKVMIIMTIVAITSFGILCFVVLYLKSFFVIWDKDYITLESGYWVSVDGAKYQYHFDTLIWKDTPTVGKLFLKSGKSYDIKYTSEWGYGCTFIIDGQRGYYIISGCW